ncbi:MAG: deoxyribonuclease IV [Actinomycetota bacterium]
MVPRRSPKSEPQLRIGAHVGGGLAGHVDRAKKSGADTIQIFASNPRGWAEISVNEAADAAFRERMEKAGIGPLFIHAPYLVNIASPNLEFIAKSIKNASWTMQRAQSLGAAGVIVHAGAAGPGVARADALARAAASLLLILESTETPFLVVELTAGGSNTIASAWPMAAELLDACDAHGRIRFCFDTCHAHAAGYDLSNKVGTDACWAELDRDIGIDRLRVVHANDSRDASGSRRDRHAHIGDGTIGEDGFGALLSHEFARRVPWIVETPPTRQPEDIARLRALANA